MFKKLTKGFLHLLLISTVIAFIAATTSVMLLTPEHLKQWIQKSDIYDTLPSTIINQSTPEKSEIINDLSLSNPIIMSAAKSTLTPDFIQKSSEQIIDSVFVWLRGETPRPSFSINLLPIKQTFADKIVIAAKDRYNQLPQCWPSTFPKSTNPLTIECRPAYGVDINSVTEDLRAEILQNKEFLPDTTVTSTALAGDGGTSTVFDSKTGPQAYQYLQLSPYVLAGLILVYSAGIVLLSDTKRKGLSRTGELLVLSGILAMISVWVASLVYGQYQDWLPISAPGIINDIISPIIDAFRKDAIIYTGIVAGAVCMFGLLVLVLVAITMKKSKQNPRIDMHIPKSAPEGDKSSTQSSETAAEPKTNAATSNQKSNKNIITPSTAPVVSPEISKKLIQ